MNRKKIISKLGMFWAACVLMLGFFAAVDCLAAPVVLRYAGTASMQDCGSVSLDWYLNEIEKQTNGAVKFEKYWSGTLVPSTKVLEGVSQGMADIGQIITVYYSSLLPLHGVCQVPGTGQYSTWARSQAWMELYQSSPELKAELDEYNVVPLNVRGSTGMNLISKKPVRTVADLKGMKIRVAGYAQHTINELGAVPVSLKWDEIYMGFERGVVDGTFQDLTAMTGLKLYDIGKYVTKFHQADAMLITVMNKNVYNKLPDSVKKVMAGVLNGEKSTTGLMKAFFECPSASDTFNFKNGVWQKAGVEMISLSARDEKILSEAEAKIRDKWIKEKSEAGVESKGVVEKFIALCAKWDKKTPPEFVGK